MVWHHTLFFLLQKAVQNSPNQLVIYSFNFSVFRGQKNDKRKSGKEKEYNRYQMMAFKINV